MVEKNLFIFGFLFTGIRGGVDCGLGIIMLGIFIKQLRFMRIGFVFLLASLDEIQVLRTQHFGADDAPHRRLAGILDVALIGQVIADRIMRGLFDLLGYVTTFDAVNLVFGLSLASPRRETVGLFRVHRFSVDLETS